MPSLIYVTNTRAIAKFFSDHIPSARTPTKVTRELLTSIGLKSNNDRGIIRVLEALGFIDSSGGPTEMWRDYRDAGKRRSVMAAAIKSAYADLYAMYSDAHQRDDETITNNLRGTTDAAAKTVAVAVRTFRLLCGYADFDAPSDAAPEPGPQPTAGAAVSATQPVGATAVAVAPTVVINIQLQMPATDDPNVYDRLFAALKKHLG